MVVDAVLTLDVSFHKKGGSEGEWGWYWRRKLPILIVKMPYSLRKGCECAGYVDEWKKGMTRVLIALNVL